MLTEDSLKIRTQGIIILISVLLLLGKFFAYLLTNSVGVLTDAMESIVNVVAAVISYFSLRFAAKPRDKEHPFGHGKIELVSASFEGLLIILAGGIIIFEGGKRLFYPSIPDKLDVGILIVAISGIINYLMGAYSIHIGRKHKSVAMIAGGKHFQSDTYSTIGLVIGLIVLNITKIAWIDSALALLFGSIIVYTGVDILRKTTANLLDRADEESLTKIIKTISENPKKEWIDIHGLRVIKYGTYIFINFDLTLPWFYNIDEATKEIDIIERRLQEGFSNKIILSIHIDSCKELHCNHCNLACVHRKVPFSLKLKWTLPELTKSEEEHLREHQS